ncbi:hypothetical protein OCK74_13465 [Chitinophagaceae bacterium LB-8]|uniref:Lipoprotein n=1 Tax=Paraflavisolibacter caeni TaxID=2982496 RepID=A0A9X2XWR3_9BACT|nr:hypothetical protein [Paraflavisolibacter caeni]MCU7550126.1 hypothetical protein [Paraflavisolibacter caeni]
MKTFILTLLFGFVLISCEHKRDVKTLRKLFNETNYDTAVIQSTPLYDSLKNIIISYIDTIFKFRNSRHFVYHGDTGKETQEDADFYNFYYNYGEATSLSYGTGPNDQKLIDEVSVENMPTFIYPSVDRIFKQLGKDKILGFTLWKDSTIEITVKSFYREKENADVGHILVWKRIYATNIDPDFFYRDTLIAPKWTYQIWVDDHQGF